ncbi:MAG: alginate lyase family protein, partial [Phycisphaerae bacterium]
MPYSVAFGRPRDSRRRRAAAAPAAVVVAVCVAVGAAAEWSIPQVTLPTGAKHPVVACTPAELSRLRAAWRSAGPEHGPVASEIARAEAALKQPLVFPPRGGQHNQWYQCEACQMGLKTVDATHHRCGKCGKVYTGQPYDDVIFGRIHDRNLRDMIAAAWAWAITGRQKYADFARGVLLGYAERYRKYPYHDSRCRTGRIASRSGGRLFEQTLNEAAAMSRCVAPACDLVHDVLSTEDRTAVRDGLLAPMLENIAKHQAGKSNWQTWHNAGMLWGGAVLGEARWVRLAVADPKNGFAYQMGASVSDEGMWYENSWGYHFYTLSAMVRIVEGARRLGIDLWGHPRLRKMFTLPARYAMADGSLPRFGDAVGPTVAQARNYAEVAYNAFRAPELAGLLPERPTWETVMFARKPAAGRASPITASEVFPGAGHAILRTKGAAGLTAALTFGPYGGFHGHYDKLSFVLFGHGRELGVDPGRARSQAYRLPIHGNWYKATVSHNAVLVDGASQSPAAGKLESFAATESHAAVVASCDAAYPGVRHRRMLCMTPAYLLVLDRLAAEKPRQFTWVYHNRGTDVRCGVAGHGGGATGTAAAWR